MIGFCDQLDPNCLFDTRSLSENIGVTPHSVIPDSELFSSELINLAPTYSPYNFMISLFCKIDSLLGMTSWGRLQNGCKRELSSYLRLALA
jgi:hypothetical protein